MHNEENVLEVVSKYISNNFDEDFGLDWVNIGGGSTIQKLEKNKEIMFKELGKIGVKKIILEPGRYLVDKVEDVVEETELYVDKLAAVAATTAADLEEAYCAFAIRISSKHAPWLIPKSI